MRRLILVMAVSGILAGSAGNPVALADPVPAVFPVTIAAPTLAASAKPYRFTFALFDVASGGASLWSESKSYLLPATKKIKHQLGSVNPGINPINALLFNRQLWVEASAAGKKFSRVKLGVVPYAVRSELAGNIEGQITAAQVDATGAALGDVLSANGAGEAAWLPPPGDIAAVNTPAGGGLKGGSSSGSVSLGLLDTCGTGEVLKWDGAAWACAADEAAAGGGAGTVTQVITGTGLTGGPITDSGTIAIDPAVVPRLGAANAFTGMQTVQTGGAAAVGLTVQGAPAQSANLQEWKNSAGVTLAALGPTGTVMAGAFSGSGATLTGVNAAALDGQAASAFAGAAHIHGGADIASGTVATARLSVGTAAGTVAAGDHGHDTAYVNEGQAGSVTSGMIVDGAVALADLGQNGCGSGQVLKWDGTAWACAADADSDTDTGVNAVTDGGGITGSIAGRTLALGSDATVQRRSVAPSCADGQYLKAIAADGSPTCAADGPGTFAGWSLSGNLGTNPATNFIGTTDDVPFEIRVNNQRALRLGWVTTTVGSSTYVGQNAVGGDAGNSVTAGVTMATIAGGGGTIDGLAKPNWVTDVGGTVGGGRRNQAGDGAGTVDDRRFSTVGGGAENKASGMNATVAGGWDNRASGESAAVGGGDTNGASGAFSTVAGGFLNSASGVISTVSGGESNTARSDGATVGGGWWNWASGQFTTVTGGRSNGAFGNYAAVGGGWNNTAGGDSSFAAGRQARVRTPAQSGDTDGDEGTFAWADSTAADFESTGPNQFLIRAGGGVGINKNNPGTALDVNGTITAQAPGASGVAYVATGDRGIWGKGTFAGGTFSHPDDLTFWADVSTPTHKIRGTGAVSFVQNHPYEKERVVVYAAPEGDEVAVYTRGSARLVHGVARVKLGRTFALVANPDVGLTAHITPRGGRALLWVKSVGTEELVVRGPAGSNAAFDYLVYGLRIGYEEVPVVQPKRREAFLPDPAVIAQEVGGNADVQESSSLERFRGMRAAQGDSTELDLSRARALAEAIGHRREQVPPRGPTAAEPPMSTVVEPDDHRDPIRGSRVARSAYNGVVTTDANGYATVELPERLEAGGRDIRYQLTVIGGGESWARARIAEEVSGNRFVIQTDVPGTKVSWQVTGTRRGP